ncbi:MAG: hypothetical protein K0R57_825 [Paenibacillaceae bacterium]|nr:hypothetical protein [Paenibacillaceae bacterium]
MAAAAVVAAAAAIVVIGAVFMANGRDDAGAGAAEAEGASMGFSGPAASKLLGVQAEASPRQETPPLPEALRSGLESGQIPPDSLGQWLAQLQASYRSDGASEVPSLVRADLDGDGRADEWAAVLLEEVHDPNLGQMISRAYGAVIAAREGSYSLASFMFPEEAWGKAKIEAVEDLTGDGLPDILWASFNSGAHTVKAQYTASSWTSGGDLLTLDGAAEISNPSSVRINGGRLEVTGGQIGSAGAGPWQREYTDSYKVRDGGLLRTGRVYTHSANAYHRLMDGLWAEAMGDKKQAQTAYTEAAAMKGSSYSSYAFEIGGEWVEGGSDPIREKKFEQTVNEFALLRLELLHETEGSDRREGCAAAKKKSGYKSEWLAGSECSGRICQSPLE